MYSNGDEAAFRELYERHHRAVLAYLLRRLGREEAFDAAEDVFLVAWRRLADIPPGNGRLPWLYGVARRVVSNHRRTMFRRARLSNKVAANPPPPLRGPEDEAIAHAESDAMLAALATLRSKDQEVLRLTYWEELAHADIGRILGCSAETVHVRRYRAEKRLANALARAGHKQSGRSAVLPKQKEEGC
ncbi:MAG: sigma-70 family RNA polymerase sigma factor [Actinomycetota bacterium]